MVLKPYKSRQSFFCLDTLKGGPENQELPDPRTAFLKKKFANYEKDEILLENFHCAFESNILLQGMIYLTNKRMYFYSPFNNKSVIGQGSKLSVGYTDLA